MKERQKNILKILKERNDWITGKELSLILNCSDRTIRNDVNEILSEHEGSVISSVRSGYKLSDSHAHLVSEENETCSPETSEERSLYIIRKLFNSKSVSLYDLQNELNFSESTIRNDIKNISSCIETSSNLKLSIKKNHIYLTGSETSKRQLYKDLLTKETKGDFININKINELFPTLDLSKILNLFVSKLEKYEFSIRNETYIMFIIHIGVAVLRMQNHWFIDVKRENEKIDTTLEFKIAEEFYTELSSLLRICIDKNEIRKLAALLMGKKHSSVIEDKDLLVDAEKLTKKVLQSINDNYDIDFSNDEFFKDGILLHIQNMIERLNNQVSVSNIYLYEIKNTYPLVFEIAVFVGHIIERYLGKAVKEDELGYLAIHIGAAYDRLNLKHFYHAILIHPNNIAMKNLCSQKIMDSFGNRIIIDTILNYYDEDTIVRYNPDLIISNAYFNHDLDIPVVFISMFVNDDDEYKLFKAINEMDRKRRKQDSSLMIKELVDDEFFFYNYDAKNYEEVIEVMCDNLYKKSRVEKGFKQSAFEREKMAYTSFHYGYAIPHSLEYLTIKSTISIMTLKKPIQWGNYQVQFVMLLAIKEDDKDILRVFFDWFSCICDDTLLLSKVIQAKTSKELIEVIVL